MVLCSLYLVSLAAAAFCVLAVFKRRYPTLFESSQWLGCLAAMLLALSSIFLGQADRRYGTLLGLLTLWTFPAGTQLPWFDSPRRAPSKQFFLGTLELAHRPMIVF
jgi:hypothetical protein